MKSSPKTAALLLCAGAGRRAALGYNKIFFDLGESTVVERTVRRFLHFDEIVVIHAPGEDGLLKNALSAHCGLRFAEGGASRSQSVRNGLAALPADTEIVAVHDGARPFVTRALIDACVASARETGSGVAALPSVNALKMRSKDGLVSLPRDTVYTIQTPQAFSYAKLLDAYARVSGDFADDSEVFERAGYPVTLVEGSPENRKLTDGADFFSPGPGFKTGFGFDVHRLEGGRRLILGGVEIPFDRGLLGHSDADVLTHAVMDALLSAAGLPDIGSLFPNTDPAYKNADSLKLLGRVTEKLTDYRVLGLSAAILAQRPKLAPYLPLMREKLAAVLTIDPMDIGLSATTAETLGLVGGGRGMAAFCTALIRRL
ncbi:MAG: 2-C-methyl-D-erythritol 2,4-cyclodiphosphate synthase [Clostridiales bacterium]|jgi:2-C-methyl-D-erythritol 4-phosphate cytidylyltransferase/2-C-methyl-D-erythritol 2,4-cyclodiphosphate synthase|nr:2-C-methyl-D-erythritol 2,4-cyclodiphosphate synthase [Clostridiales bacterium]